MDLLTVLGLLFVLKLAVLFGWMALSEMGN